MTPTKWTLTEAGEDVSGPIRLLDWEQTREVNLVRKTWWRSMRHKPNKSTFRLMSDLFGSTDYWQGGIDARDRFMQACEVRLAVSPGGSTVLGWAVVKPEAATVVYVYVDEPFRRRGLARQLVSDFVDRDTFYGLRTYDSCAIRLPERWRHSTWRLFQCV